MPIKVAVTSFATDGYDSKARPEGDGRPFRAEAYALGQEFKVCGWGRPREVVCQMNEGDRIYVAVSDTYQTGAVFTVKSRGTGGGYSVTLNHRNALAAGFR